MAKIIYADKDKKVVFKDVESVELEPSQVRIKTAYSYISAGTELTVLQMGSNLNMKMEVPHIPLGYSFAGKVVDVGANVTRVKPGDKVVAIGKSAHHATENVVQQNQVVRIPGGVSLREAAPAAMMCFALEGVRKAQIGFGENVLVLGAGPMGQIASQLAAASGGRVFLTDLSETRLAFAVDTVAGIKGDENGWERIKSESAPVGIETGLVCFGGEATAVFHKIMDVMTVAPDGVPRGRIVSPGGCTVTVQLASGFGNIEILSSAKAGPGYHDDAYQSGIDYPLGYCKWTFTRNIEVLLAAVARKTLKIDPLITHEYAFEDALKAYQKLAVQNTDALITLLKYE